MARFSKGNPGGPGRPKGSNFVSICREWAEKKGWDKLISLADGKDYKVGLKDGRVVEVGPSQELQYQAARTLIEYGYGRPSQSVDLTNAGGSFGNPMAGLTESQLKKLADANDQK